MDATRPSTHLPSNQRLQMPDYRKTYRKAVTADMCDIYLHMNVQFYVSAINDSSFSLMSAVGLGNSAREAAAAAEG